MEHLPYRPAIAPDNSNGNGNGNGNGKYPARSPLPLPPPSPLFADKQDGEELSQALALVRRRWPWIVGVALVVFATKSFTTLTQTPLYEGNFQILVEPVTADQKLEELTVGGQNIGRAGLDYPTQIQVLQSPELINGMLKQMQGRYPELSYGVLINNLAIARLQETKILDVRFRNSDPEKVHFVLQQLAAGYLRYSLQERQTNLRQGIQFVDKQLPQLQSRVDQLQRELQAFRQQNEFIDPDSQGQQLISQRGTLAEQRLRADQELAAVASRFQTLQSEEGGIAALKDSAQYQSLLSELREVEVKVAEESTRFQASNPAIRLLQEKRNNLLPLLRQEAGRVLGGELAQVATEIQELEVRSQAIASAQSQLDQQIQELPVLARRYADFQRELQVAIDSLNRFLATREKLQVEAAQTEIPWQLISAPVQPLFPISPDVNRSLMIGLVMGLVAGMGVALVVDKLDNVFHTPEELKERTKLPLLGSIPYTTEVVSGGSEESAPAERPVRSPLKRVLTKLWPPSSRATPYGYYGSSSLWEAFYLLHTNVRMLGSDSSIRSVLVSSALPGDGKSTVSVHLAQAAATMGQRVLIVDADMRNPTVNKLLGVHNLKGLSDFIANRIPVQDVIQSAPQLPNLYVLPAGQIPPDPTKLLSSQKMQYLMEKLPQSFDLVIFDAPPLTGLADATLLATHTNGMILVASMGKTNRTVLAQALDAIRTAQLPILGIVANRLKSGNPAVYEYYYRNYYHRTGDRTPQDN